MLVTAAKMLGGKRRANQLAEEARARATAADAQKVCERPLYGWCDGNHSTAKPAQIGMMGLCRLCYKATYPDEYAWKAKVGLPGYRDLKRARKSIHLQICYDLKHGSTHVCSISQSHAHERTNMSPVSWM